MTPADLRTLATSDVTTRVTTFARLSTDDLAEVVEVLLTEAAELSGLARLALTELSER